MKFSISLRDELFGERLEIETPRPDGSVMKRSVTKKWFERMQAEGKISNIDKPLIQVHMLHVVNGYYVDTWTIGEDVLAQTVEKFRDASTDALYAMTFFKDGKPEMRVMAKSLWDEAKSQMQL